MCKSNLILLLLFLLSSPTSSLETKSSNLRKNSQTIPDIDSLLSGLPTSYSILSNTLISDKPSIAKELSLSYFKSLETNSKIEFFLNKDLKDFDAIMDAIISLMGISNPQHAYVHDIFKNKIPIYEDYRKFNTWMNYNIITTVRYEKNTISFGSLFVSFNEGKFNFIFCYGNGAFKVNFSADNVVFLGANGNWKYVETSRSDNYSAKDFEDDDVNYLVRFMNLVGFKVIGNKYNLQLPYPEIN